MAKWDGVIAINSAHLIKELQKTHTCKAKNVTEKQLKKH